MAYYKRKRVFKRRGTKRTYRKRNYNRRKLNMMARTIENKRILHTFSADGVGAAAEFSLLNGIAGGTTQDTRNGHKIVVNYLSLNLAIEQDVNVDRTHFRCLIVYDSQCNGSAPQWQDIFSPSTINGLRNVNQYKRFRILYDRTIWLNTYNRTDVQLRFNRKMALETRYDGANAVVSDITKGSLYFIAVSDQATYQPTVSGAIRVGFYDN